MVDALAGRRAVVTGGASGIGLAIAQVLTDRGARVVVVDRQPMPEGALPPEVHEIACDVTDDTQVAAAMARADEAAGGIDVLVNCAGVSDKVPVEDVTPATWSRIVDVNLRGAALCIGRAVPRIRRGGGGAIVNITSIAAFSTTARHNSVYAASKGGLAAMTRALVLELAPEIRVNAVAPGPIASPMTARHPPAWRATRAGRIPAGRLGDPAEIGRAVAFLASDDASFVNGHVLVVDGGLTAAQRVGEDVAPTPT